MEIAFKCTFSDYTFKVRSDEAKAETDCPVYSPNIRCNNEYSY